MSETIARGARLPALDGLRAVGFVAVFSFHTWEFSGRPDLGPVSAAIGQNIRPDLFVVLTGFLLFLPLARDSARERAFDPRHYARRRLRRILPPYYAALALAVVLPSVLVIVMRLAGQDAQWQRLPTWGDLLTHLTFTHLFFPDYWASLNGSLWTMSLEMQLYVLFPVLVLATARFGNRVLWTTAAVSVGYLMWVHVQFAGSPFPTEFLWRATFAGRAVELVAGMLAARVACGAGPAVLRDPRVLTGAVVVGYLVATVPLGPVSVLPAREMGLSVMFAALVVLCLTARGLGSVVGWRGNAFLGVRSYSLFLVHQPLVYYLSELMARVAGLSHGFTFFLMLWVLGLALVGACGQLMFVWVERPSIAWSRRVPSRVSGGI